MTKVNDRSPELTDDPNALLDEEDGRERVLLVEVDGRVHAIPIGQVREVLRTRAVTRVPGTPAVVKGLVNVRGMVVTVLDLAACLRSPTPHPAPPKAKGARAVTPARAVGGGSIVLLEHGGRLAGLAVEAVRDVRPLDETALVGGQAIGDYEDAGNGVVRGLASAGNDVVVVLDVAALLARHLISSAET